MHMHPLSVNRHSSWCIETKKKAAYLMKANNRTRKLSERGLLASLCNQRSRLLEKPCIETSKDVPAFIDSKESTSEAA